MINPETEQRLRELVNVFLAENENINLSAFRTEELCWTGNVEDSLAALDVISSILPHPQQTTSIPRSPETSSIPQPLPPEEEGGLRRERTCRPRNKLFFAREMRKNPTEAEGLLWEQIRHDIFGVRFRRQFLCAGAIFDFYCPEQHLALELDGGIHSSEIQRKYDRERDAYFREEFKIFTLRFSNDQVLHDINRVLAEIKKHIHSPPPREEGVGVEVRILDLGTGGGFPLLPLAICLPHCSFVGLDSVQKKISAVNRIMNAMNITNVSLICGRAEELGHDQAHRGQYDIVLCRAVAEINVLLEYAAPFAKVGGHVLLWKSMMIEQELQNSLLARAELTCHLKGSHTYELAGNFGKRQILIFQKTSKTSDKYPREVGLPKKTPLL